MTEKKLKQPKKKEVSPITKLREANRKIKDLEGTINARSRMSTIAEIKFSHQAEMIKLHEKTIQTLEKTIYALARAH